MPASGESIFKNSNIIKEILPRHSSEIFDIYQPGMVSPYHHQFNHLRYSGYITSLRLTVDITSINELIQVPIDDLDSDETINQKTKDTFNNNPKKLLNIYLRNSTTPLTKVADIYLFNTRPYYYIDLLSYLTQSATFDVAPDSIVSMGISDIGDGVLGGLDRLLLLGTVIEEATKYSEAIVINNISSCGNTSPGNQANKVEDKQGTQNDSQSPQLKFENQYSGEIENQDVGELPTNYKQLFFENQDVGELPTNYKQLFFENQDVGEL